MITTQDIVWPLNASTDRTMSTFSSDGSPFQSASVATSVSKPQSDPGSMNKVYQEVQAGTISQADVITDVKSWIAQDGTVRFGLTIVRDPDTDVHTDVQPILSGPSFTTSKDYCFEEALYQSLIGSVRTDLPRGFSPLDDYLRDNAVTCRNMYLGAVMTSHEPVDVEVSLNEYLEEHRDLLAFQAFGGSLPNEHPHLAAFQALPTVQPVRAQRVYGPPQPSDLTSKCPHLGHIEQYLAHVQRPQLAYLKFLHESSLPQYPEAKWPFWPGQQVQPFLYQQRVGYPMEMEWESTSNLQVVIGSNLLQPVGDSNFSVSDLARWWHEVGQHTNA